MSKKINSNIVILLMFYAMPEMLIFLVIIAFIILFSFLTFLMSIKPGKWPIEFTPESFNLKYEEVNCDNIVSKFHACLFC